MADTMFNIFGDNLSSSVHKPFMRVNKSNENPIAGKSAFPSALTPAKALNCLTPRNTDSKKKSFLQNKGTPIQLCSGTDYKRKALQNVNKNLQIYEDNPAPIKPSLSREDNIVIEYSRKPPIEDEDYLSDSDMALSEENIDSMIFDISESDVLALPKMERLQMKEHSAYEGTSYQDILSDLLPTSHLDISDSELPSPF